MSFLTNFSKVFMTRDVRAIGLKSFCTLGHVLQDAIFRISLDSFSPEIEK
jgi:hypothetical protein